MVAAATGVAKIPSKRRHAWRILLAFVDPEEKPVVKRIAYLVTGLAYGGLGVGAFYCWKAVR